MLRAFNKLGDVYTGTSGVGGWLLAGSNSWYSWVTSWAMAGYIAVCDSFSCGWLHNSVASSLLLASRTAEWPALWLARWTAGCTAGRWRTATQDQSTVSNIEKIPAFFVGISRHQTLSLLLLLGNISHTLSPSVTMSLSFSLFCLELSANFFTLSWPYFSDFNIIFCSFCSVVDLSILNWISYISLWNVRIIQWSPCIRLSIFVCY